MFTFLSPYLTRENTIFSIVGSGSFTSFYSYLIISIVPLPLTLKIYHHTQSLCTACSLNRAGSYYCTGLGLLTISSAQLSMAWIASSPRQVKSLKGSILLRRVLGDANMGGGGHCLGYLLSFDVLTGS